MKNIKTTKKQEQKIKKASENLIEIQKRISPFIKPSRIVFQYNKGQWEKTPESTNIILDENYLKIQSSVLDK